MKTSHSGLAIIAKHEGFRSAPYLCPAGVPTIGYGNTFYPDGRRVTMQDTPITKEEPMELLKIIVAQFEAHVNKLVTTQLGQNQFDALVSFTYNLGPVNLGNSTLLKKVNAWPCDPSVRDEFMKWNKAGGKVLAGLTRRRKEEADLYFS